MEFCTQCGTKRGSNEKFCNKCGFDFRVAEQTVHLHTESAPAPAELLGQAQAPTALDNVSDTPNPYSQPSTETAALLNVLPAQSTLHTENSTKPVSGKPAPLWAAETTSPISTAPAFEAPSNEKPSSFQQGTSLESFSAPTEEGARPAAAKAPPNATFGNNANKNPSDLPASAATKTDKNTETFLDNTKTPYAFKQTAASENIVSVEPQVATPFLFKENTVSAGDLFNNSSPASTNNALDNSFDILPTTVPTDTVFTSTFAENAPPLNEAASIPTFYDSTTPASSNMPVYSAPNAYVAPATYTDTAPLATSPILPYQMADATPKPSNDKMQSVFSSVQNTSDTNLMNPASPPPIPVPSNATVASKQKRGSPFIAFLCIILGLLLFAAATFTMLYLKNSPEKMIDNYIAALEKKDAETLADMTTTSNIPPENIDWSAYIASFENETERTELRNYLSNIEKLKSDHKYSALNFQAKEQKLLGLIIQYDFILTSTSLSLPATPAGTSVKLNNKEHITEPAASGIGSTVPSLMPGKYTCQIFSAGGSTEELLSLWEKISNLNNELLSNIQILNCLAGDADIYVNDALIAEKPIDNVLTLSNIPLQSTIRIRVTVDGDVWEASVGVGDGTAPISFTNYVKTSTPASSSSAPVSSSSAPVSSTSTPAVSSSSSVTTASIEDPKEFAAAANLEEVNGNLSAYYRSYLECLNTQQLTVVQFSTALNNKAVEGRMAKDLNKNKGFAFVDLAFSDASLVTAEDGGKPSLLFNATFKYTYLDEGVTKDGSNTQTVQMIYEDATWKVNRITFVSTADYAENKLAAFPA